MQLYYIFKFFFHFFFFLFFFYDLSNTNIEMLSQIVRAYSLINPFVTIDLHNYASTLQDELKIS